MKINAIFLLTAAILTIAALGCKPATSNEATENNQSLTEAERAAYIEKGKAIAGATFTDLSGNLQAAMQEGGVSNAIAFCNVQAYPLTDSLSQQHQATIRRTTLKPRNPKNAPIGAEETVLEAYAQAASEGAPLGPKVELTDEQTVAFYAPIKVNAFCLQCHGKLGETLADDDYAAIKEHYPKDAAIGYTDGDLRGMWSIRFRRE